MEEQLTQAWRNAGRRRKDHGAFNQHDASQLLYSTNLLSWRKSDFDCEAILTLSPKTAKLVLVIILLACGRRNDRSPAS